MNLDELAKKYGGSPVQPGSSNFDDLAKKYGGVALQPKQEEPSGVLRQVADVPLSVGRGALSGVRMIADAFGAGSRASEAIKGAEGYLTSLMSAQARNDEQEIARIMKDAEDKGMLEQVKAGFKAFTVAPVDLLSQGLGTAAPTLLGLLGGKVLGAGALATRAVGAGIGAGMGAGTIKGSIYEETKRTLMESGVPEQQAEATAQQAQAYGGKNLDQILLGAGLGVVGGITGAESAAKNILFRAATKDAAKTAAEAAAEKVPQTALREVGKAVAKTALTESVPEFLQASQEQIAQNIALQREGFDVPTLRGAVGAGTLEALAGAGLGGAFGGAEAGLRRSARAEADRILAQEEQQRVEQEEQLERDRQKVIQEAEARRPAEEPVGPSITPTGRPSLLGGAEDPVAAALRARREADEAAAEVPLGEDYAFLQREKQRLLAAEQTPQVKAEIARIDNQIQGILQRDVEFARQDAEAAKGSVFADETLPPVESRDAVVAERDLNEFLARAAEPDLSESDVRSIASKMQRLFGKSEPETDQEIAFLQAEKDLARLKAKSKTNALLKAVEGSLAPDEVSDIGIDATNKSARTRLRNRLISKGKRGTYISEMVDDGLLDEFLEPSQRIDSETRDVDKATEFIKDNLRSGNYAPWDIDNDIKMAESVVARFESDIKQPKTIQYEISEATEAERAARAEAQAAPAVLEVDALRRLAQERDEDISLIEEQAFEDARANPNLDYETVLAERLSDALGVERRFQQEGEPEVAAQQPAEVEMTAAPEVLEQAAAPEAQGGININPQEQKIEAELTGKSMLQVADWTVANAPNAFARVIAEKVRDRLRAFQRKGMTLKFTVAGGSKRPKILRNARGMTEFMWGAGDKGSSIEVLLNGAAALDNQAGFPPGMNYTTVLHELLHVATRGQFRFMPNTDPLKKQLIELFNLIADRFNADAKAGTLPPVMQRYYKRLNNVLSDPDEMLAWGMTDKDVQSYFDDIKVGEKSVFTRLVELIRTALGLGKPYESALERLVRSADALLDVDVDAIDAMLSQKGARLGVSKPAGPMVQERLFQQELNKTIAGWSNDRINALIRQFGYADGRTKAYAAFVDPDEFVNGTTPTAERKTQIRKESGKLDIQKIRSESQTPFLFINQINKGKPNEEWQIVGHEGRHRMSALSSAGVRRVPVVLVMQESGFASPDKYQPIDGGVQVAGQSFDTGTGLDIDVTDMIPISSEYESELASQFGKGDIRFQQEGEQPPTKRPRRNIYNEEVQSSWNEPDDTKLYGETSKDDIIRLLQDKMVDTKRVIEAIASKAGKIANRWNPYLQEELYHGRTAKATKDFLQNELRPLMNNMQRMGITIPEFEQYLHNRHAPSYNAQVAKVNPNDADMQDGGSGVTNDAAKRYMDSLPEKRRKDFESLAEQLDSITKGTRQVLVDSGLERPETIEAWEKAFPNYVPLQREDIDFQYTTTSTGVGQGFDVRGSFSRRAMGSKRKVVDILANVAMQRERAIVRANKNRVSQALFGLAVQNPNPDFWLAIDPMAEVSPAAIEELVALGLTKEDAQFLMKEPQQKTIDKNTNEVVSRVNTMLRNNDNVLSMRFNGRDRYVFFNPQNDRAANMAKALKNLDADQLGRGMSLIGTITRWMAAVNTQYNPIFGAYNFLRDVQGAALQLSNTPLAGSQKQIMGGVLPALKGIYADLRADRRGEKVEGEWSKLWNEFQAEGGQTGFRDQFSRSQERAEALEREMKQITEGKAKAAGRAVLDWLSDYNDTMENAIRLSAYKAAKEKGMSREEAASLAKNLTVNFNRKGQIAVQAGALYAFFNAAVQGTTRLIQTLRGPMGKKIIGGGLLLGSMQAALLAMAGFDEEEPPEFVRERNLILPIGEGKYLSFPMPLGYHVIPGVSRILTEWALSGFKDTAKRAESLTGMFLEAFNPIGNAGWSVQSIAPTFADPLVALTENRDWTGKPIARKDFSNLDPTPGYTRAKDTASWFSEQIAYYLNLASGGTKYQPGVLSPTPDQLDYLIGQAFGGLGREFIKAQTTAKSMVTGEDLPTYKIPLVGRFVGDTKGNAAESARFYSNLVQLNKHENEIKGRRDKRENVMEYIRDNPEARLVQFANKVEKDVQKLRQRRRDLLERGADREAIQSIENLIANRMKTLNTRMAELEG